MKKKGRGSNEKKRFGKLSFLSVIALLLSAVLIVSAPATAFANLYEGKGDINGDGVVNYDDYELLRMYVLGMIRLNSGQLEQADINDDGVVNPIDMQLLYILISLNTNSTVF